MDKKDDAGGVWLVVGGLVALAFTRPDLFSKFLTAGLWSGILIFFGLLALGLLWYLIRAFWGLILAGILILVGGRYFGEWGGILGLVCAGLIVWANEWWREHRQSGHSTDDPGLRSDLDKF